MIIQAGMHVCPQRCLLIQGGGSSYTVYCNNFLFSLEGQNVLAVMNQHIEESTVDICKGGRTPYSNSVIIIGASSDIGLFLSKHFVRDGYNVVPVDFHLPKCKNSLRNRYVLQDMNLDPLIISEPQMLTKTKCAFDKIVFLEEGLIHSNMPYRYNTKILKIVVKLIELLKDDQPNIYFAQSTDQPLENVEQHLIWLHAYRTVFNLYHVMHKLPTRYLTVPTESIPEYDDCCCHECEKMTFTLDMESLFLINNADKHLIETVEFPYCSQVTCDVTANNNVIMSTYFTRVSNPQYTSTFSENNFRFFQKWFQSAANIGAYLIIFHDGLEEGFQKRIKQFYKSVQLIEITDFNGRSPNDYRFYLYYNYLKEHEEVSRAILTDIRDVEFTKDPFKMMVEIGDYMYVGLDKPFHVSPLDMKTTYNVMLHCHFWEYRQDMFFQHPNYNAGVLGGTRVRIMSYLEALIKDFSNTPHGWNCNMASMVYVMMKYFQNDTFSGYPFQAGFDLPINGTQGCAISHKSYKDYNVRLRF